MSKSLPSIPKFHVQIQSADTKNASVAWAQAVNDFLSAYQTERDEDEFAGETLAPATASHYVCYCCPILCQLQHLPPQAKGTTMGLKSHTFRQTLLCESFSRRNRNRCWTCLTVRPKLCTGRGPRPWRTACPSTTWKRRSVTGLPTGSWT